MDGFDGLLIDGNELDVKDVAGQLLMKRRFIRKSVGGDDIGFFDIAVAEALGATLLHVGRFNAQPPSANTYALERLSPSVLWKMAQDKLEAAHKFVRNAPFNSWRPRGILAYSFPKLGLEVEEPEGIKHIFDIGSWDEVHELDENSLCKLFGSWSILDKLDKYRRKINALKFKERVEFWNAVASKANIGNAPDRIDSAWFEQMKKNIKLEVLHERRRLGPKEIIPQGQVNGVWCVPASVYMALSFFDVVDRTQDEIANDLGLNKLGVATTLSPGKEGAVKSYIDAKQTVDATIPPDTEITTFFDAASSGKPIISFIPAHCRLVIGISEVKIDLGDMTLAINGLNVLDPWPSKGGRTLYWESFEPYDHELMIVAMKE
jgi:hypothetical protein